MNWLIPFLLDSNTQQDIFIEQAGSGVKKLPALQADNAAGARILSNVDVSEPLVLTNGDVNTNGNVLTASDGASNVTVIHVASVRPNAVPPRTPVRTTGIFPLWELPWLLVPTTLTFNYQDSDLNGATGTSMAAGRYDGEWEILAGTVVDTVNNTTTVAGVSSFSSSTLGDSAALPVFMSGFSID